MFKNLSAKYYQKIEKDYKKKAHESIKIFPKKKKKNATIWSRTLENISEDERQKLVKYRKKYYRMRKNALL